MKKHKIYLRYSILIIMTLALQACSFKYVYNQLDWIVANYIEDFASLDEAQSELLYSQIQNSLYWHRTQQLPQYSIWLKSFRHDIESGLDTKQLDNHLDSMSTYIKSWCPD